MIDRPETDLKLIALDAQDLSVISTHLQDSVMRVGELDFDRRAMRFACVVNRFDWLAASKGLGLLKSYERRRAGLRFERVLGVRTLNIDLSSKDEVLSLLAVSFAKGEPPGGRISLLFSGGGVIELNVECIEAELRDLGAAWATHAKPVHRTEDHDV